MDFFLFFFPWRPVSVNCKQRTFGLFYPAAAAASLVTRESESSHVASLKTLSEELRANRNPNPNPMTWEQQHANRERFLLYNLLLAREEPRPQMFGLFLSDAHLNISSCLSEHRLCPSYFYRLTKSQNILIFFFRSMRNDAS